MTMQDLAAALAAREARPPTPYGLYRLTGDDPAAELARAVERDVFLEFFGNTPELLAREYGPFEGASHFLLVLDHETLRPAGACRLIEPSPAGNKTVEDVGRVWGLPLLARDEHVHPLAGAAWDVATLAVGAGYRGTRTDGLISAALFQGITMFMATAGVRWVTATLDLVVLDLVQSRCREPFVAFPGAEPRSYLDSPLSLPVYCDGDRYRARLAQADPGLHELLFAGVGLEDHVSVPCWAAEVAAAGTGTPLAVAG
jgi:hypothetical protein